MCYTVRVMKCTGDLRSLRRNKLYTLIDYLPTFKYFEIKWGLFEILEFWIILKYGIDLLFPFIYPPRIQNKSIHLFMLFREVPNISLGSFLFIQLI